MGSAGIGTTAKLPPANAVSPGAESVAHFNKVEALSPSWHSRMAIAMGAAFPGITRVVPVDIRNWPRGANVANCEGTPGGGAKFQANGAVVLSTDKIVSNPRTLPCAIGFRAKIAPPAAGQWFWTGIGGGVTASFALAHNFDDGTYAAADPTKTKLAIMRWSGALNYDVVGNWTIDNVPHDFMFGLDTVESSWYLDSVRMGGLALSDGLGPSVASHAFVQASGTSSFLTDFCYGF